jgi:hypothetical protein
MPCHVMSDMVRRCRQLFHRDASSIYGYENYLCRECALLPVL